MKKISILLLAVLSLGISFTSCADDAPFSTAAADDNPRILDPVFPDRVNGELPVIANISRDANLGMNLTVTPADYTTVVWFLDGQEAATGTRLDLALKAGTYHLKVVASTGAGKSTYREGIVQVNPLAGDPWAATVASERIIAPGTTARLYGDNLQNVTGMLIGSHAVAGIAYVPESGCIEYAVPADIDEGDYRVVLTDAEGNEYGANTVKISKAALVVTGANRANANAEWTLTGINLENVASLTIGGQTVTSFVQQTAISLTLVCPALADGDYQLTGRTKSGEPVRFYAAAGITDACTVVISSERTLWEGHHYVSWDLSDDNPNKTFNLIGQDVFARLKAGSTLRIYYSVAAEAEYHQLRTTTGWWNDLPGTSVLEFSTGGVKDVVLTQEVLNHISEQGGFLCVGHGYYVDRVTVQ